MTQAQPRGAQPLSPALASVMWLIWLGMSMILHVAIFVVIFFPAIFGGGGGMDGGGLGDADGLGGTSIEMEIAGPEAETPQGANSAGRQVQPPPSDPEPPPPPQPTTTTVEESEVEVIAEPEQPPPRRRARERRDPQPTRDLESTGDPTADQVAATGEGETPQGTGAEDTTAGTAGGARDAILGATGALGSGPARDALLPDGAMCPDPVAGVWRAQKYRSSDHTWVRFILRVQREGDQVSGTITSRIWTGSASDPRPGRCTPFGSDHTWLMEANGRYDGSSMTFGSRSSRMIREDCPAPHHYAPDNFTGRVDPERDVFDALNNDGAFDVNEPYVFRRISCE